MLQELPDKSHISGKRYLVRGYYCWKLRKKKQKTKTFSETTGADQTESSEQLEQADP